MPECKQRVLLLSHTPDAQALIALGARLCYAGGNVDRLMEKVSRQDQQAFLEKLMGMGHESVLEHVSFTFLIEGVSRVLLAQLTRHRIASFSVQSQRYVSYKDGFGYVVPPAIAALGEDAAAEYRDQMAQMQQWYENWQERRLLRYRLSPCSCYSRSILQRVLPWERSRADDEALGIQLSVEQRKGKI